jgi:hypothetical protein
MPHRIEDGSPTRSLLTPASVNLTRSGESAAEFRLRIWAVLTNPRPPRLLLGQRTSREWPVTNGRTAVAHMRNFGVSVPDSIQPASWCVLVVAIRTMAVPCSARRVRGGKHRDCDRGHLRGANEALRRAGGSEALEVDDLLNGLRGSTLLGRSALKHQLDQPPGDIR